MNRKLHLHVVTTAADHDPYDPTCMITVPLGSGLGATVQDGSRRLTVADLGDRHTSASLLWQDAATEMLATLGNLTSVHGTALRHRDVDTGIREIAVIGTPSLPRGFSLTLSLPCRRTASSPTIPAPPCSSSRTTSSCSFRPGRPPQYPAPGQSTSRKATVRR